MWFEAARKIDPGPCPVDDAPHTTCVAPTTITSHVQPSQQVTVPMARPCWMQAPDVPPPARTVSEAFTTATYRRRKKR